MFWGSLGLAVLPGVAAGAGCGSILVGWVASSLCLGSLGVLRWGRGLLFPVSVGLFDAFPFRNGLEVHMKLKIGRFFWQSGPPNVYLRSGQKSAPAKRIPYLADAICRGHFLSSFEVQKCPSLFSRSWEPILFLRWSQKRGSVGPPVSDLLGILLVFRKKEKPSSSSIAVTKSN